MKVIVGIDFSVSARTVADAAKQLVDKLGGELTLLHVIESIEDDTGEDPEILQLYNELLEKSNQRLRQEEQRLNLVAESSVVVVGIRHQALLEAAVQAGAELLVLGSRPLNEHHTQAGIGHRVACLATLPVMLVPVILRG